MIRGLHRAAALASLVAAIVLGATLPCAAQVALDWSAPRGCPDTAYVARQLAAAHAETPRPELRVRARISLSPARPRGRFDRGARGVYVLRLVLRANDFHAERRLEASSCTSVTDAAIWLINVALAPAARAHGDGDSAAPAPSTGVDDSAAPPAATSEVSASSERSHGPGASASSAPGEHAAQPGDGAPDSLPIAGSAAERSAASERSASLSYPSRRAPWRLDWAALPRWWRAGVFAGVWSAGLPAPQVSVGARLGFGIGALYAELRGGAELSRKSRLADATEAHFATQDGGLAVCAQWGDRLRVGPCATAAVLRTTGGSRRAPEARDQVLPWSAAGVALALGWRAPLGVEVMLETGVQLPLSARPRFTVEGVGEVAVAAPLNVYARLGLGFRSADIRREQ